MIMYLIIFKLICGYRLFKLIRSKSFNAYIMHRSPKDVFYYFLLMSVLMFTISTWLFIIVWITQLILYVLLETYKDIKKYQNYASLNKKESFIFSCISGIFLVILILI